MEDGTYWKLDNAGEKIYYFDNKQIGYEFSAIKHIILKEKVSSSMAHKLIKKIKEFKADKK